MIEDTSWFFDEEWQKGERAADKDLINGKYKSFETIEDLLNYLHNIYNRKK